MMSKAIKRAKPNKQASTIVSLPLDCMFGARGSSLGCVFVINVSASGSLCAVLATVSPSQDCTKPRRIDLPVCNHAQLIPVVRVDARLGVNSGSDARRCGLASATTYLIHARWECLVRSIHLMTKREEINWQVVAVIVVAVALVLAAAPVIVGR